MISVFNPTKRKVKQNERHNHNLSRQTKLEDPDPSMPPEKVLEFHALLNHPELTNAQLKGPIIGTNGEQTYKVELKVGKDG